MNIKSIETLADEINAIAPIQNTVEWINLQSDYSYKKGYNALSDKQKEFFAKYILVKANLFFKCL